MNWKAISRDKNLSEDFIREHKNQLDWETLSRWIPLSKEDFIEEMNEYIYWSVFSWYRNLSEEFMEQFKDQLTWYYICSFQQCLSYEFIKRNISYITIPTLQKNKYVQFTEEEWEELKCLQKQMS